MNIVTDSESPKLHKLTQIVGTTTTKSIFDC